MVGRVLGHYRLLDLIGAGGMGEVYRARDERLDRDVALKVLPQLVATDPDRLARFEREAKALARLEHSNILTIHDFGFATTGEGEHSRPAAYAVTELLNGETLRECLARENLSWRRAASIAAAVAEGLAAAHSQGVVHRDIKPENLFLTADGRVKILDFGLATSGLAPDATGSPTVGGVRTVAGAVLGTVGYMAPEQVQGTGADARSDIFALGCVLFEMLSGGRAFARPTPAETLAAILSMPAPDLSASAAGIPPDLGRVVARCLEKQPGQRFQSASDLAFALTAIMTTGPGLPAGAEPPGTRPAWSRRRRRVAGATVATLVIVAAAAASWLWLGPGGEPVSPRDSLDPEKVVVAVFANRTGDASLDALGLQASDWLTQSLTRIGVKVALNPEVPSIGGPGLPRSVLAAEADPLRALAVRTGAGVVITGAYYLDGDSIRVQSQIVDGRSGTIATALAPSLGPRARPNEVVGAAANVAMGAVAARFNKALASFLGGAMRPPAYDAYLEFNQAMAAFGADYVEAERRLKRTLELDANYAMARLCLWAVFSNQNRPVEADEVLRALEEPARFGQASPWEQAYARYARASLDGNRPAQLSAASALPRLAPGPMSDYHLALAHRDLHQVRAAIDVLSRIRVTDSPPEMGSGASWHLSLRAALHHEVGEYDRQLELARLGQETYPAEGGFFTQEVSAIIALGRLGQVDAVLDRCSRAVLRSGSLGATAYYAARELLAHGHPDDARRLAGRAAAWYKTRIETGKPTPALRNSLAHSLVRAGDCEQGLGLRRELAREAPGNLAFQSFYATALLTCGGSRGEALKIADALARVERPFLRGEHLYQRARILAALGDGDGAVRALQAAFGQGDSWDGTEMHLDTVWDPIRSHPAFVEFMRPRG